MQNREGSKLLPGKKKNEIIEEIFNAGGSSPFSGVGNWVNNTEGQRRAKFPSSFNRLIQHMLEVHARLIEMVRVDIPRAFPFTDPVVKQDSRYRHASSEMFYAQPLTILQDANAAHEVCSELKRHLTTSRTLLSSLIPRRIESSYLVTEIQDKFQADIQMIDEAIENIDKIENILLRGKMSRPAETLNRKNLEKLKNHIIKIGYDYATKNSTPFEIFPELSKINYSQIPITQGHPPNVGPSKMNDSSIDVSDRLMNMMKRDERGL